jgi:hypothetical protein
MHRNRNADARMQRAVLGLVLYEHPKSFTLDDLVRQIGPQDAVGRAVTDLTAVGLLREDGGMIVPTDAALHFERLGS